MTLDQAEQELSQLLKDPRTSTSITALRLPDREVNDLIDRFCELYQFIERERLRLKMIGIASHRGIKTTEPDLDLMDPPDPIDIEIEI